MLLEPPNNAESETYVKAPLGVPASSIGRDPTAELAITLLPVVPDTKNQVRVQICHVGKTSIPCHLPMPTPNALSCRGTVDITLLSMSITETLPTALPLMALPFVKRSVTYADPCKTRCHSRTARCFGE
jgi:hypothetical protein